MTNKTCAFDIKKRNFIQVSIEFLRAGRYYGHFSEVNIEFILLRDWLLKEENPDHGILAQLYIELGDYRAALRHVNKSHEDLGINFGNTYATCMSNCYELKTWCYIKLKNKPMAKKALHQLKKFKTVNDPILLKSIQHFESLIKNMPNNKTDTKKNENIHKK
jgi:tetratricopeptide (TPR) repeat protein